MVVPAKKDQGKKSEAGIAEKRTKKIKTTEGRIESSCHQPSAETGYSQPYPLFFSSNKTSLVCAPETPGEKSPKQQIRWVSLLIWAVGVVVAVLACILQDFSESRVRLVVCRVGAHIRVGECRQMVRCTHLRHGETLSD